MTTRRSRPVFPIALCVGLLALVTAPGCDLLNPERPTPRADTILFGNLLEVESDPADPGSALVSVRVSVPRELAEAEDAKPTPPVEKGLLATVTVGEDTVVVLAGGNASLDDFAPGAEVVAIPVEGTTQMVGSSEVLFEAAYFLDFDTYRRWKLPRLAREPEPEGDPARINSPGVEHAPVPVGDGHVLYFAAHLRPPAAADDGWHGARRPGLSVPADREPAVERSYRTELGDDGWSPPEPVVFPGLDEARVTRVSWVSEDETRCLVTVVEGDDPTWVGVAERPRRGAAWGAPRRVAGFGEADASDAVYLAGSHSKLVFATLRGGGGQSELFFFDPKVPSTPLPLEPKINTIGHEWGPRIGPQGELFFVRRDRQLLLMGGQVQAVRLPGPHRSPLTEAAPTQDGSWLFFCVPRYRPLELDLDIWVAPRLGEGRLGDPVPVDEWRRRAT